MCRLTAANATTFFCIVHVIIILGFSASLEIKGLFVVSNKVSRTTNFRDNQSQS